MVKLLSECMVPNIGKVNYLKYDIKIQLGDGNSCLINVDLQVLWKWCLYPPGILCLIVQKVAKSKYSFLSYWKFAQKCSQSNYSKISSWKRSFIRVIIKKIVLKKSLKKLLNGKFCSLKNPFKKIRQTSSIGESHHWTG